MNAKPLPIADLPVSNEARRRSAAALARACLAASTARYERANDLFERRMAVRFMRWEDRGLLVLVLDQVDGPRDR